tara:strand:- start:761 stop:1288 length:528 start_codon:yes stop_codon:yes gene_type:complete
MYKWGNPLWHTLYIITFNLNDNLSNIEKDLFNMFLKHIVTILPCQKCQIHYKYYWNNNRFLDISTMNRNSIIDWLYNLDMSIKIENGKAVIDKSKRIESMGNILDMEKFMELLCSMRTFFYTNTIRAKDIYIFMVYLSILLPDKQVRDKLKDKLGTNCNLFNKELFDNIIHSILN